MPRTRRSVLVCFAVREEAKFFSPPEPVRDSVSVLFTGIGPKNAERALTKALDGGLPDLVLTCGFAGGLRPGLPLGAVLYSAEPAAELSDRLSELGALPARFCCSARVAVTAADKAALWTRTHADAVEMESGTIHRLCQERRIPNATIRVISDGAERDLPLDFNLLMTEDSGIHWRALAGALLRSPGKVPALIQFQRQTQYAARKLGKTLGALLRSGGSGGS